MPIMRLPKADDITNTFLSTQSTGAISRMVELGQVQGEKSGLGVAYLTTQPEQDFRSQIDK